MYSVLPSYKATFKGTRIQTMTGSQARSQGGEGGGNNVTKIKSLLFRPLTLFIASTANVTLPIAMMDVKQRSYKVFLNVTLTIMWGAAWGRGSDQRRWRSPMFITIRQWCGRGRRCICSSACQKVGVWQCPAKLSSVQLTTSWLAKARWLVRVAHQYLLGRQSDRD